MFWRWAITIIFLLASLWVGNLALFNWWAAGGPPTANPQAYAFRGNIFFVLACIFFVVFIILLITNIRRFKNQKKEYK